MRSPDPPAPSEALLHGEFGGWSTANGDGSNGTSSSSSPNSPATLLASPPSSYALTLTYSHLHVQRLSPRPGKEACLLLPLEELVGCSCPRTPAPPLLVLYWYPAGKKRKCVSRRRQVKAYLAESRAEAERWAAAVQCLLRGVNVSSSTEFSRSLLPRPRRLLLLVNPFSGRGLAVQWCQTHILPMIREANISYNLIQTERQNHARELVRDISLPEWDGIIIISGDGLLHEVINGLLERPDWEQAIKTPVGILPCGSGNALAGSINHYAGYDMCLREPLLQNCCFLLCRGGTRPMDLVSVTTSTASTQNGHPSHQRLFSFLSVAWGFVSDVDIESERYRSLGSARFTLGTLVRLASLRSYKGRLSYLPSSVVTSSPAGTPPPQRRPLSRSITEGFEGICRTSVHRTISDMGLSEQRSLRKGDREREREERDKERERRRERARGVGVTRASSLAEDREREQEAEEMEGESLENEGKANGVKQNEEVHSAEFSLYEKLVASPVNEGDCGNECGSEVRDMEYENESCGYPYEARRGVRKNSAPSTQLAGSIFVPVSSRDQGPAESTLYCEEEPELNGSYSYQREPYASRERSLTISSPFRHKPFLCKPKPLDHNPNAFKSRPVSLVPQHAHSNSLPPTLPSVPAPPSPGTVPISSYLDPQPNTPLSPSPFSPSFTFDMVESHTSLLSRFSAAAFATTSLPTDDLLPPLDQPLPTRDWVTIEGDFVLVLAIYQTHLGAELLAAPQAAFDDGLIHITFVRAGISRATLLRMFLAMERGAHLSLSSPYVSHVTARAFRLQPLSPRGTLTVDGEVVPYGPLQAQIHPAMAKLIVGDTGVKTTRF